MKSLPRAEVQVATKFALHTVNGQMEVRGDPEYVRQACEDSLQRLGMDYIDLYYQHRVDTKVPIEVTVSKTFVSSCDRLSILCPFCEGMDLLATGWRVEEAGGRRQG